MNKKDKIIEEGAERVAELLVSTIDEQQKNGQNRKEILNKEILGEPQKLFGKMKELDNLLTDILKNSNQKERDDLEKMLWRWRSRALFVDALQEQKDIEDAKIKMLNKK